ncbi:hypothetical protein HPB51_006521 [Rhipicephalus microplus]|uniref:mRNA export factor n=1 Tax=Rhipicephalus microplus TaxID=6941 RepID=A0A9J6E7G9_RHIMP|nr:hypothetical protein HPB51_006521 [Rhipicephalus microplus]
MFGSAGTSVNFGGGVGMFSGTAATGTHNPMKDFEVVSPPEDSISSMAFSPASLPQNFLVAGSWDNQCLAQRLKPILSSFFFSQDGSKVFSASCDKTVKMWDLNSNQAMSIAQHDAPVKTVHWVKAPNYSCIMTGSWDKTLKFWDTRTPTPMLTINLPERCYCADVVYPMAVVSTAGRSIIIYQLEGQPQEYKKVESPLKYQVCTLQYSALSWLFRKNPKDNFTFKCHRANGTTNGFQEIFAVNLQYT